jgi:alkylation response protein AidB-like acyl-CoA dehydrogenase
VLLRTRLSKHDISYVRGRLELTDHSRYVWNDRKQFGQLVGDFQGMQHQIAQSYTEIAAARALVYNAARKKEAGEDFVKDAAMAKLFASQVAGRVSGLAVQWMGGKFHNPYQADLLCHVNFHNRHGVRS